MSKQSKPKKSPASRIFLLIFILYLCSGFVLPIARAVLHRINLPDIWTEKSEEKGDEESKEKGSVPDYPYCDLVIRSVEKKDLTGTKEWQDGTLSRTIPELKDLVLEDGYHLYQFDVVVFNEGTDQADYDNSIYVGTDKGVAVQCFHRYVKGDKEKDTRILPPGREAVVTVYAIVKNGTPHVYVKTFSTRSINPAKVYVEMEQ